MFKPLFVLRWLVRRTVGQIALGVAAVFAVEVAWIGASSAFVTLDFGALGLWLAVTGALILVGTSLALLGPTPHGGIATNSQDMLVSSGTRSLWDLTKSPGLHVTRSQALVAVGVGSVLILLGALFTVL